METYAPAAVLINRKHECLYSLGPTERYLRVAPGQPTHDLLAMARHGHAHQAALGDPAGQSGERAHCRRRRPDRTTMAIDVSFSIDVQPVLSDGERAAVDLLRGRDEARAGARPPGFAGGTSRGSPSSSRNSKPRERSCRAPSATSRFPAKSRRRSTKKRCLSMRNTNRRTRSC